MYQITWQIPHLLIIFPPLGLFYLSYPFCQDLTKVINAITEESVKQLYIKDSSGGGGDKDRIVAKDDEFKAFMFFGPDNLKSFPPSPDIFWKQLGGNKNW